MRLLSSGGGRPWAVRKLLTRLAPGNEAANRVRKILRELEEEGLLTRREGSVRLRRKDGLVEAEFRASRGRAGGRVFDDNDEFSVDDSLGARNGDRVLVWPRGRRRAEVVQVLSPASSRIVGRLVVESRGARLEPYGRPPRGNGERVSTMRVAKEDRGGAVDGDMVEATLVRRGRSAQVWARVERRLGRPGEPEADYEAISWRYRLPTDFPDEVQREAELASARSKKPGKRRDLRELAFLTIDPASARDHDDAVCVERAKGAEGPLRLWVAIADVAHFVSPGSALEREAEKRGNSVYLPDRSIPMLPHALSSEACSLVPNEDRLVLVAELVVAKDGSIAERKFHRGVIRSRARLSYEQAAVVMEGGKDPAVDSDLATPLRDLGRVAERLRKRRVREGSIELELPEPVLELDADGMATGSVRASRTIAHRSIEEAMLAANRGVAGWLDGLDVPVPHRVHEAPAEDALRTLARLLVRFGLLPSAEASEEFAPRKIAKAVAGAVGKPFERLVHWTALRSMQQARYSPTSLGHYALGFEHYLHFTSPIRRIADLAVHRAMHRVLESGGRGAADAHDKVVERVCVRASVRERVAQQAERAALRMKQCALVESLVGDVFEGRISGLTEKAIFVTLDDPYVDGALEVSSLGSGFELSSDGLSLVAPRSGDKLEMGNAITVRVESVDTFRGQVRLGPASGQHGPRGNARSH